MGVSSESPTCLPPWLPGQHISVSIKRWCLPQMHLSPQRTVLRDPTEGLTSQWTGPRGAAARVLTKRLKLLRNIASKVGSAELRSAGLSGKVPSTEHTAAWAAGAKRTGGRLPGHQHAACTAAALLGSERCPRLPQPPTLSRPRPASLTARPHARVLGTVAGSLPLIWPQHRRPSAPAAARGEDDSEERGREGGGALGSSCGEGTLLSPPALGSASLGLHSSLKQCHRPPSPLASPRASAPLGAQGDSPRHPAPHLASAWHYSTGSIGSHSLPWPGPNSSTAPLHSQPLCGPRPPALRSRTRVGELQCRPPARPEPTGLQGFELRVQDAHCEHPRASGAGKLVTKPALSSSGKRGSSHYPFLAPLPPTWLSLLWFPGPASHRLTSTFSRGCKVKLVRYCAGGRDFPATHPHPKLRPLAS